MANKIEILVEVDPTGKGAAKIKVLGNEVDKLGDKSRKAGSSGRDALDGFAGGLGVPTSIAAASATIAGGILLVGQAAIQNSNNLANAQRILKSDAQEVGKEFKTAQAEARKFGEDLALSNAEASVSYARLIRLIKAGGLDKEGEKITKNFENLTAAYGLTATEIETLTQQLLSGQDEALNKLGLADPSQLYIKYAASVGKTVDALSEEEKVRARILAVSDKGARFEGAAEQRLVSQVGLWAQLSKYITDSSAALGDYLQKSTLIGTIPILLGGNPFTADLRYEEYLKQKADAEQREARAKALRDSDAYFKRQNNSLGVPEALANPYGSFKSRVTLLGAEDAEKEKAGFISQYEALFKDKRLDKVTAQFAERQFETIRGIFDPAKAKEIEQGFAKFWDKYAKVALGALKTARDAADKNFASLADKYSGGNNPYVKVLTQADETAKNLQKTFGALGDKTVKELQKVEEAFTRQKILGLQIDSQLKARQLTREANRLASPTGLSGADERQLDKLNAGISAAQNIPGLLARADAIARGLVRLQDGQYDEKGKRIDPKKPLQYELALDESKTQKDVLRELLGLSGGGDGLVGRRGADAINKALIDAFEALTPDLQARIATGKDEISGYGIRDAYRGRAEEFRAQIRDEIEKSKVADKALGFVREDIAAILEKQRQGLSSAEADKRLLNVTGELDPKELTADIRQARIEALRREADRQTKLEEDAVASTNKAREATEALTTSIDNLAKDIRSPQNRKLLIEVKNRTDGDIRSELYGSLVQED